MKKIIVTVTLFVSFGFALTAQNQWPDITKYADIFMGQFVAAGQDWKRAEMHDTDPAVNEKYARLAGEAAYLDTPLEAALYRYYSGSTDNVPAEAEAILPFGNPRLVDRQLGALVHKRIVECRFLNDSAAAGRWEAILQGITGRGNVTKAETESFYRQNIGGLIAGVVDEEFGKVIFSLDKGTSISYTAVLTFNPKTKEYTLSYERPSVENDDKKITASSLSALLTEMRSGNYKADFDQGCINQVSAKNVNIPTVLFTETGKDPRSDLVAILTAFYLNPTNQTVYGAVRDVNVFYTVAGDIPRDVAGNRMTVNAYQKSIYALNPELAQRVTADSRGRTSTTLPSDVVNRLRLEGAQR